MALRDDDNETSRFDTTEKGGDRFLFFKVSPELAPKLDYARGTLMGWVSDKVQKAAFPMAKQFAKNVLRINEAEKINRFGSKTANMVGFATILSKELSSVGMHVYDSAQSLGELRSAVSPLKSADTAPLSGSNEVVANARAKINGIFWQNMLKTATGAIAIAPALWGQINKQKEVNLKREHELKLNSAKSEDDLSEIIRTELKTGKALDEHGAHKVDRQKALKIALDKEETLYNNRYAEFATEKRKADAKAELTKIVEGIDQNNYHIEIEKLAHYGVNVEYLRPQKDYNGRIHVLDDEELEHGIASLKKKVHNVIDNHIEHALKSDFVQHEGVAFNNKWVRYQPVQDEEGHRPSTTEEQWRKEYNEKLRPSRDREDGDDHHQGGKEKNSEMTTAAAGLGGAIVSDIANNAFFGGHKDKYSKPVALDRILQMRRELDKAGDSAPEQLVDKYSDRSMSYAEYVHSIFEQHQRDSHRTQIGERFIENLKKANWDDAAVQQLSDEELNPYEYAIKTISKRIKDGRMDSIAMINLVGDKAKKIVHNDGRNFGPSKGNDTEKKAAILKMIDEQTLSIRVGQDQTEAQLNDKLGNFIFSLSDLKHALESNVLSKDERSFVFTIFSDAVGSDKALCKKLGVSDQRCEELRKECKTCFNTMLDNGVVLLADIMENAPQDLEKLRLTDKEKELIGKLAASIKNDNKHAVDSVENREELKSFETVVVNAAMSRDLSLKDDEGHARSFLQRLSETRKVDPRGKTESKAEGLENANNEDVQGRVGFDKKPSLADAKFAEEVPEASNAARLMKERETRESEDPSKGVGV